MGGCQNYGPFLGPYYNTAPNISGTQKGTIILTTTHMLLMPAHSARQWLIMKLSAEGMILDDNLQALERGEPGRFVDETAFV